MRAFSCLVLAIMVALVSLLGIQSRASAATPPPTPATFDGSLAGFKDGRSLIEVNLDGIPRPVWLKVSNTDLQKKLLPAMVGDEVQIVGDDGINPTTITALSSLRRPVSPGTVLLALFASVVLLYAVTSFFLRSWIPRAWLLGVDMRYSNSQTQLALWFATVATIYIATNFLRTFCIGVDYLGGISLTTNLIALTGFSAFTFGAAKMITGQKVANAQNGQAQAGTQMGGAGPAAGAVAGAVAASPPDPKAPAPVADQMSIRNLVQNDKNEADLGDLEMILITIAAVLIFLIQSFWWLTDLEITKLITLPDVDNALMSSFGIGQGAYLFKKAAMPVGEG